MIPRLHEITRIERENADTFTVWLKPESPQDTTGFLPGQFNMLYVFGVGEVPISISGDPARRNDFVHTVRAVGSVTEALFRLPKASRIGVRGPFGSTWPVQEAPGKDVILIAGGIGLAPLRPVLYHVAAHRKDYGRVSLLLGARTPQDLLFQKELANLAGAAGIEVEVTVDHADRKWRGNVGVAPALIPELQFDTANAIAMICGPEVMMRFTVAELQRAGLPDSAIYLSIERNMKCGIGLCGHCQFVPHFICRDGPVFNYEKVKSLFGKKEV